MNGTSSHRDLSLVVLVGSLRQHSLHRVVAKSLAELVPEGVTLTHLDSVGTIPHYDADVQADGFPESVIKMGRAIHKADGIVIVTPEYNYSAPGVLKNALDWLSRLPDLPFSGKPVSIITGSPGPIGGARAQYHLRQVMVFLDAFVFNKPEVMIGGLDKKVDSKTVTDEATRNFLAAHLSAFLAFVRRVS